MSEKINNTQNPPAETQSEADLFEVRLQKLASLKAEGRDPYEVVKFARSAEAKAILSNYADYAGKTVTIAGRVMSKRIMGKASFCHIADGATNIQLYLRIDELGDAYEDFKKCDIGDIVGVKGEVFTTHKNEISVKVAEFTLLSKSLLPLPEKYHGLTNNDLRYRQRYVDLIVNPEVKDTFVKRSKIIGAIRRFLDARGYLEVETPILNSVPGGASARPFVTHHNTLDIDMYLRIAPELYLKRLIVGGLLKVYEIGRLFRNEGMSIKHNPEFTTIELYEAYADYHDMMDISEELFRVASKEALGTTEISYQGTPIDLGKPWRRVTMVDLVKEATGIDFGTVDKTKGASHGKKDAHDGVSMADIIKEAEKVGVELKKDVTWGNALYTIFDQKVEATLIEPTFVLDYPVEVSPLAKRKKADPRLTERFEFFIYGREMGNAFSELNDPIDQKARFAEQLKARQKGDDEAQMPDDDFVTALEYGMPPTGGLGIGIDRMVMLLTDNASIRDVLLFPTMKPTK